MRRCLADPVVRATWAPRGETPVLRHKFNWRRMTCVCAAAPYRPFFVIRTSPYCRKMFDVSHQTQGAPFEFLPGALGI
jgi:hypothetical protein